MDKSRILLISGFILAFYGAINVIFIIMIAFGISQSSPEVLSFSQSGGILILYALIQGFIPLLSGLAGMFWRREPDKAKLVMACAWVLIIAAFGLFFTTYGQDWTTILFYFGCVLVSIIYFYGAKKNLRYVKNGR